MTYRGGVIFLACLVISQLSLWPVEAQVHPSVVSESSKVEVSAPQTPTEQSPKKTNIDFPFDSGPGPLTPDSPLFFLDKLWDNIRLLFTIDPVSRAKLRLSIASERLAEIHLGLENSNQQMIEADIVNLSDQIEGIDKAWQLARRQNHSMFGAARELSLRVRELIDVTLYLRQFADSPSAFKLRAVEERLWQVAVSLEQDLDDQERANHAQKRLVYQINQHLRDSSIAASLAGQKSSLLSEESSQAALLVAKRSQQLAEDPRHKIDDGLKQKLAQYLAEEELRLGRLDQDLDKTLLMADETDQTVRQALDALRQTLEDLQLTASSSASDGMLLPVGSNSYTNSSKE